MYAADRLAREEFRKNRRAETVRLQRARRTIFFFLALTLIVVFRIGFGFGTLMTRAEEPEKAPAYKYYSNIEIKSGDTLWDIADTYMDGEYYKTRSDYISEVMEINGLSSDTLISGESLIVPYYSMIQQ